MKWLLSLSAAQTVLLAALGLKVVSIDMQMNELATGADAPTPQIQSAADPAQLSWDNARAPSVDAAEMRAILKEELAALEHPARAAAAPTEAPQTRLTPEQIKTAANAVAADINHYRGVGAINPGEMEMLQEKIAKLPRSERRAALTELARAMTRGEIDGLM
ncbi:hypothetical protein [Hyphococcus sp.]|jgi:hypothetical protein|uniref:hypothetical protein n=1 Tax=Hyphococcus sp. TaxID=2038636 RepID=UPI003D0EA724